MNCLGCGLPMEASEMGVNFKGEKVEYHGFQAKCVELLRAELGKKDLQNDAMRKVVEAARAVGDEWKRSCTYDNKEVRIMWAALDTLARVTEKREGL